MAAKLNVKVTVEGGVVQDVHVTNEDGECLDFELEVIDLDDMEEEDGEEWGDEQWE